MTALTPNHARVAMNMATTIGANTTRLLAALETVNPLTMCWATPGGLVLRKTVSPMGRKGHILGCVTDDGRVLADGTRDLGLALIANTDGTLIARFNDRKRALGLPGEMVALVALKSAIETMIKANDEAVAALTQMAA